MSLKKVPEIVGFLCLQMSFFVSPVWAVKADITVAADGSGNYKTVQEGVTAAKSGQTIFVKAGTYKGQVKVSTAKIRIIGASYQNTIITCDLDVGAGRNTHASVIITGDDFYAEQITIQNTVDSRKFPSTESHQAEALRVSSDRAIFYKCCITGFQDTYYFDGANRVYHKDCIIDGTTDFIYGDGIALFENCTIRNRKNSHCTAANHELNKFKYGFVFKNCTIALYDGESVNDASLGRPMAAGARVVYLNCSIGSQIRSDGWSKWSTDTAGSRYNNYKTAYYAEYKSTGPGAQPEKRVPWSHQLTDAEAALYTTENIFKANATTAASLSGDWVPVINSATKNTEEDISHRGTAGNTLKTVISGADAVISYTLASPAHATLALYDMHGRQAVTVDHGMKNTGVYSYTLKSTGLSCGLYVPRLTITDAQGLTVVSDFVTIPVVR